MAKTQKYSNEQLLEAVELYAKAFPGKIEAKSLADWASKNIDGMKGVREYMFRRDIIVTNPDKNKPPKKIPRPCKVRMDEINESRRLDANLDLNVLLSSSNVDLFFSLPKDKQRKIILDTRSMVDRLKARNYYLERANKTLSTENSKYITKEQELESRLDKISESCDKLYRTVKQVIKSVDEEGRKRAFAEIGISDERFDFNKFLESLSIELKEAFSIQSAIKQNTENVSDPNGLLDELTDGLEFE